MQQAYASAQRKLNTFDPVYTAIILNLGLLDYQMGDYLSAESLLKQAVENCRVATGELSADYGICQCNLGLNYVALGDFAAARRRWTTDWRRCASPRRRTASVLRREPE